MKPNSIESMNLIEFPGSGRTNVDPNRFSLVSDNLWKGLLRGRALWGPWHINGCALSWNTSWIQNRQHFADGIWPNQNKLGQFHQKLWLDVVCTPKDLKIASLNAGEMSNSQGDSTMKTWRKSLRSTLSGTLRSCGASFLFVIGIEDPNKSTRAAPKLGPTTWVMPPAPTQELPTTGATGGSGITEHFPAGDGSIFVCHPRSRSTNPLWFASFFKCVFEQRYPSLELQLPIQ